MDAYSKISAPLGDWIESSVLSGPEGTGYCPFHLCGFWVLGVTGPFSLCGNVTLLASVASLYKIFCHV